MPSPTIAPLAEASPIARAGVPAVHTVKRHGTRGKGLRVFIVARQPA